MSYDAASAVALLAGALWWATSRIESKMADAAAQRKALHAQLDRIASKIDSLPSRVGPSKPLG